ncbi:CHAD domain-containing protein [uncultured Jatrophihabitans sp.]|uniref:CYTH and CHAD domain-containing protein n=1 Tax=uncultured Jatrophihabitans sp. TaxID=1610747 RepID=UPI0035CB4E49
MTDTQRERELKFDLPDTWELPDVSRFVPEGGSVQHETQRLESTYFDTAGRDLFGSLVTLRRRTGDADNGWHLKIPMDGARQEIRLPLEGSRGVPAELRTLTAGLRGRAALRTIATLRTEREVRRIVDAEGAGLAEIVHDTVTATVKHEFSVIRSWHEAEVELLGDVKGSGGDEKLLARIATWLGKYGAEPSASMSKLGRALEASAHPARPTSTAAGVIGAYLNTNFAAIVAGDVTLRRDAAVALAVDELHDSIHATRVASRRYRSTLRIFAAMLDGERAAALDAELSWFAAALGEVRDRHVLRRHLDAAFDELAAELVVGPVRRRVGRTLDAEEAAARAGLNEVMASARYIALLAELRNWTADLPVHDFDEPAVSLERLVRKASRTMDKRIAAAQEASTDDAAYHRARKAAKRARYAGELAIPVMGKAARQLAKQAKKRQELLGDRQDEVVAAEFLLRLGTSGGNGFTLGVLHQRQRALAESGG